ncbi:hypothetical protein ABZ942_00945 [Nocardia sp. NPDC046473]|uniref:hypothetical protein n=1 Tax=Nocardia sp. NPDC046473 TaxID=3155733 RepID=UPI0033FEB67A
MRTRIPRGRGALLAAAVFAIVNVACVAVSPRAIAITEDEREQQAVMAVHNSMCGPDGSGSDERSAAWYAGWMEIEKRSPYVMKNDGNPSASARKALYDEPDFNADTRQAMCIGLAKYAEKVKEFVVSMKGSIKSCCVNEAGLKKFFKDKIDAFQKLTVAEENGTLR